MSERTYPYTAWTLKPSFKPAEVTIVRAYGSWAHEGLWDVAEGGKSYRVDELFPTKEAAIDSGWSRILVMEEKLEKQRASLGKKREVLAKASGKA